MRLHSDSGDLRIDSGRETLERITKLVNDTLANSDSYIDSNLTTEDVLRAIDNGKSEGGSCGRHWVLDPIDGTKGHHWGFYIKELFQCDLKHSCFLCDLQLNNRLVSLQGCQSSIWKSLVHIYCVSMFVRGDQYAIALALLDEGKVVLGVLACPNLPLANIYAAIGWFIIAKVYVSATENPEDASFFESYEAAHSLHVLSSTIAKKLGVKAPLVRIDSQAKYGALSRGDGAIYLRFPHKGYREKIWDHAAGCIVVTEAGGVVTDAAGNPLDISKGSYLDLETGIYNCYQPEIDAITLEGS
ncbi:putative phosphoric monoester hydrolase [Rosa chinensis]|uniref:3'(2'),5'-bisphosphate nucleotidase n=1 Tax=Rosa chinensis TaxID=74649 RepID=A0A2P6RSK9_ROSCH|nr:putative phosphoric monoester hydrolase [Rosa chinensis]